MSDLAVKEDNKRVEVAFSASGVQLRSMDEMGRFCRAIVNSGLAPSSFQTPEQVMVAIQCGLEIGLPPMQALQTIAVINGRPSLFGDGALALAMAHQLWGGIEETHVAETNTAVCKVWRFIRREDKTPKLTLRTFSEEDAKRAKLWGRSGPWTAYPKRMLQMRARSFALRDAFPDALRGVGISEEVSDYQPMKPARGREVASNLVLPDAEPESIVDLVQDIAVLSNQIKQEELL
jgi:hypothetical protein